MPRILIVNTRHFPGGGDSTYTFNLAELLQSQGHEVAFFAMQDERNLPDPNSDLFVSNVDFGELNEHKNAASGTRVLLRAIYSREARHKFRLLLDRFRPDIVHLQNIHGHITPSVVFEAKKRRLPVVWTLHDYTLICPNSHFMIDATNKICEACGRCQYYQAILRRCKKGSALASSMATLQAYAHRLLRVRHQIDMYLTPSAFLASKLVDRGFPGDRVYHLPLFIPGDLFETVSSDAGYLLFLGRLQAIKGVLPLLDAVRVAPNLRLVLAGRIEESLASRLPGLLPSNAEYVGMIHGPRLRNLLHGARAVVVPSLWYENQPFSILEAFACGKPVIASDLGGMTELVANRERGLLVRPGDVNALVEAMNWVNEHPNEAHAMGRNAYTYASSTHGAERHYADLMRIYEAVRGG